MLATKKLLGCGIRHMSTWQVFGSAMLERKAVIVKKFTPFEKVYCDLLSQIEDENSLLSDFELRSREEKRSREKKKEGGAQVKIQYAEDILAEWQQEAAQVKAKLQYSPVTDSKSPERCLDQPVTLLVKQKLGKESHWIFPQTAHRGEETLRETAERALSDTIGQNPQILTLGNAPCAFYHYKYPQDVQKSTGFGGAKIFYFKVQYQKGQIDLNKEIGEDFMWANYEELMGTLPKQIMKAVKPAIFVPPSVDFTPFLDAIDEKKELERLNLVSKSG